MEPETAVVTGGSRGLGWAIAEGFVDAGLTAVIGARDADDLAERIGSIDESTGTISALRTDVRDEFDLERLMEHAARTGGGIDVVVANAAVNHEGSDGSTVPTESYAAFDEHLRTNARGVFSTVKEALPHLSRDGRMFVVSCDLERPAFGGSYSVSKVAAEAIATEFASAVEPAVATVYPSLSDPQTIEGGDFDVDSAADRLVRIALTVQPDRLDGETIRLSDTQLLE